MTIVFDSIDLESVNEDWKTFTVDFGCISSGVDKQPDSILGFAGCSSL